MNLWLVRHAQPCVAPGVCYGAWDVPADPVATRRAAQRLAQVLPLGLQVQVSPLQRCEQLAQSVCGLRPDLTFKTDVRLAEMDFGVWEGVAWADVPQAALEAWTDDFGQHRFGGRECANEVLRRVAAAWGETCAASRQSGADTVWICHAGVARAVHLISQGILQVQAALEWPRNAPGYGQWHQLPLV